MRRHIRKKSLLRKAAPIAKSINVPSLKKMYTYSLKGIKKHTVEALGVLTVGVGVLSSAYLLFKSKNKKSRFF